MEACPALGIECALPGAEFLRASSAQFHYHGNADFKSLSKLKSRNVLEVLLRGYNVLLVDGDIVFLRDPLPHLRRGLPHHELQIQSDSPYGVSKEAYLVRGSAVPGDTHSLGTGWQNSGFYYIAATKQTIMFLHVLWAYGMGGAVNMSEQSAFAHRTFFIIPPSTANSKNYQRTPRSGLHGAAEEGAGPCTQPHQPGAGRVLQRWDLLLTQPYGRRPPTSTRFLQVRTDATHAVVIRI